MKKTLALCALAIAAIACNKPAEQQQQMKTAYIDTSKLMEEYTESKDLEAKYKAKSEEMGKELEAEITRFQSEAKAFEQKAQAYGQIWAQQNSGPLAKKQQQLQYAQQALARQIQEESGTEMDTLVKKVKAYIKDYGKKKGYDFVLGTGESATVLYAKDQYDITKDVIKELNDKYASEGKKEDSAKPAADAKDAASTETKPAEKK